MLNVVWVVVPLVTRVNDDTAVTIGPVTVSDEVNGAGPENEEEPENVVAPLNMLLVDCKLSTLAWTCRIASLVDLKFSLTAPTSL